MLFVKNCSSGVRLIGGLLRRFAPRNDGAMIGVIYPSHELL